MEVNMLEGLGRLGPVGYLNPALTFALGASELLSSRRMARAYVYTEGFVPADVLLALYLSDRLTAIKNSVWVVCLMDLNMPARRRICFYLNLCHIYLQFHITPLYTRSISLWRNCLYCSDIIQLCVWVNIYYFPFRSSKMLNMSCSPSQGGCLMEDLL